LLNGDVNYNLSLWTMRVELIGSFVCLGAAALLVRVLVFSRALAIVLGTATYLLSRKFPLPMHLFPVDLSPFIAGVTLSAAMAGARKPRLPLPVGLGICAVALYFFGYIAPLGDYAWMAVIPSDWMPGATMPVFCSVLLIFAVEGCPRLRAGLANIRVLRWLGEISFSLYLIHYLVILSVGSFVRVSLDGWGLYVATIGTYVVTFSVALALATPLAWYDRWLMTKLSMMVDRLMPRQTTPRAGLVLPSVPGSV
jgi:peptidoglycan/LPS O-acetylase OafA/YrhL